MTPHDINGQLNLNVMISIGTIDGLSNIPVLPMILLRNENVVGHVRLKNNSWNIIFWKLVTNDFVNMR